MHRWLGFGLALAMGCGPGTADGTSDSGDDDGGSSVGDSTTDSSSDTATASGDTGDVADACEPFFDEGGAQPVTVNIANAGSDPIFVGFPDDCALRAFEMLDAAGTPVSWRGGTCSVSCEDVMRNECFVCGACAPGQVLLRLDPGESYDVEWGGSQFEGLEMSPACVAEACDSFCSRRSPMPPGEYTLRAVAASQCVPGEFGECECPQGTRGGCIINADEGLVADLETSASLSVGAASGVSLVFE